MKNFPLATTEFGDLYITNDRLSKASFKQKLDPISKNIIRNSNRLELAFKEISACHVPNPVIGSLLRKIDIEEKKDLHRILAKAPNPRDIRIFAKAPNPQDIELLAHLDKHRHFKNNTINNNNNNNFPLQSPPPPPQPPRRNNFFQQLQPPPHFPRQNDFFQPPPPILLALPLPPDDYFFAPDPPNVFPRTPKKVVERQQNLLFQEIS